MYTSWHPVCFFTLVPAAATFTTRMSEQQDAMIRRQFILSIIQKKVFPRVLPAILSSGVSRDRFPSTHCWMNVLTLWPQRPCNIFQDKSRRGIFYVRGWERYGPYFLLDSLASISTSWIRTWRSSLPACGGYCVLRWRPWWWPGILWNGPYPSSPLATGCFGVNLINQGL